MKQATHLAFRVALVYAAFGVLWISLSDNFLASLTPDATLLTHYQTYKGWVYVAVTATLAFFLMRQALLQQSAIADELRESEQRWHFALEGAGEGVWDWNIHTGKILFSKRWKEMFGYAENEFENSFNAWDQHLHPEDRANTLIALREYLDGRLEEHSIEFRFRCKDGNWKWVLGRGMVVSRDQQGKPLRMVGTATDISELKLAQQEMAASEHNFRVLFENSPTGMVAGAPETRRIVQANRIALDMLGYDEKEILTKTADQLTHPDDQEISNQYRQRLHDGLIDRACLEKRYLRKDGSSFWAETCVSTLQDNNGKTILFIASIIDITERKQAEIALKESEYRYRSLFDNTQEGIAHCRMIYEAGQPPDFVYLNVNNAFSRLTGLTGVVGKRVSEVIPGIQDSNPELFEIYGRVASSGKPEKFETYLSELDIWFSISVYQSGTGCFIAVFENISERKAAEARIDFLAHHDPLTGLPNRVLIEDHFTLAKAYADRNDSKVALLFIDLDRFKNINDSLGHSTGDALLKVVAQRLEECVRDTDTISRPGGDEFVILLSDMTDPDSVTTVSNKLLHSLSAPFSIEEHILSASASIGVALYPDDGDDFETLLRKADTAMYQAKDSGRNSCSFFNPQMNTEADERLAISNGLRRALEQNEFVLYYQPMVDIADDNKLIGAEALLRWSPPGQGMVMPDRFIPVAEDNGLIVPIGAWVLREACRQAVAWQHAGLPDMVVAVNLSAIQFKRGDLERTVIDALAETGLEPQHLELELTESILISDTDNVLQMVQRLKYLGIKLSIDDFGTGYSSLSYLKKFAVDKLKIDQSFVRGIDADPNDAAIVRAIIQMARSLNLRTIAEGVEDPHMLKHLKVYHCDEAQGYHIGRPMDAQTFSRFISQHPRQ